MTLQCSARYTPCDYFLYTNKRLATSGNALIRISLNAFYDTFTASIISLPQNTRIYFKSFKHLEQVLDNHSPHETNFT